MRTLKQSTASQEVPLGPFLDSTDGNTEETGLTIANTDIKIWKTGATTLANKNSGGATHISNGIYYTVLDATDTDTLGPMDIFIHVAGALAVRERCLILAANVYDSIVGGSDALQVHTNEITAGLITAAAIADSAIDAATFAAGAITASSLAADAGAEIADAVWDEVLSGHVGAGSAGEALTSAGSGADASAIADAVWDEARSGHVGAGSFGEGTNLVDGAITAAKVATGAIDADALAADAVDEILDEVVEGTLTLRQIMRLLLSVMAGKSAGGGTGAITFRDNADTLNRISATVDANNNRTAVTLNVS